MRYFLHRICQVFITWDVSAMNKKVEHYLSKKVIEDLKLWRNNFLPLIHKGMSLNLVSFRHPSYLCWSDACPTGLGGYDHLGNARCFAIPSYFHAVMMNQNNYLEFLASIITVLQAIKNNNTNEEECFLSLGDNSSSVRWLHRHTRMIQTTYLSSSLPANTPKYFFPIILVYITNTYRGQQTVLQML